MKPLPIWTEEEAEIALNKLLIERKKYSVIAEEMAELTGKPMTRNACIGRIHRILAHRKIPRPETQPTRWSQNPRPRPAKKKDGLGRTGVVKLPVDPETGRRKDPFDGQPNPECGEQVRMMDLRDGDCKYPISEDTEGVLFCCRPAPGVYCPEHQALTRQPRRDPVERPYRYKNWGSNSG